MTKHATDPIPRSSIDDEPGNPWRGRITLGVGTVALAVATTGVLISQNPAETGRSHPVYELGDSNPYISSLTIDEGARLRQDPFVVEDAAGWTNLIGTTDEVVTVNIISGVDKIYVVRNVSGDRTGDWYGITAASLSDLELPDYDDSDGILWVNEQKASVEYEDQ